MWLDSAKVLGKLWRKAKKKGSRDNIINLNTLYSANVLARFGLKHPTRCLGLILINCTGSAASVMEVRTFSARPRGVIKKINQFKTLQTFRTKFISWKGDEVGQGAEDFLMYHKFGHVSHSIIHLLFNNSMSKEFFNLFFISMLRTNWQFLESLIWCIMVFKFYFQPVAPLSLPNEFFLIKATSIIIH